MKRKFNFLRTKRIVFNFCWENLWIRLEISLEYIYFEIYFILKYLILLSFRMVLNIKIYWFIKIKKNKLFENEWIIYILFFWLVLGVLLIMVIWVYFSYIFMIAYIFVVMLLVVGFWFILFIRKWRVYLLYVLY